MGVAHHSNYARFMEIARVQWMRDLGIMPFHIPHGEQVLGVTRMTMEFLKPCVFDDEIEIRLEARLQGAVLEIRYAIWLDRIGAYICLGETDLVPLIAQRLVPTRFSMPLRATLRSLPWSEVWPTDPSKP